MASDDLHVGFFRFDAYTNPNIGGCAPMPAPGSIKYFTIGGPRTEAQVREEIEACEHALKRLQAELAEVGKSEGTK